MPQAQRRHAVLTFTLFVLAILAFAAAQAESAEATPPAVGPRHNTDRYAIAPYCCKKCDTGPAGCCCGLRNSLPLTVTVHKITRTKTVVQTRTATKSAAAAALLVDRNVASDADVPTILDASLENADQSHALFGRNLCPVCPRAAEGSFVPADQATAFCCPRRKTVTKTVGRATTLTKKVTKTITAKPQQTPMITLQLTILVPGSTPGSLVPLANTPLILYGNIAKTARALSVLAKPTTNSAGQTNATIPASTVNTTVTVVNANTSQVVSNFTVPNGGGNLTISASNVTSTTSGRAITTNKAPSTTAPLAATTTNAPNGISTTKAASTSIIRSTTLEPPKTSALSTTTVAQTQTTTTQLRSSTTATPTTTAVYRNQCDDFQARGYGAGTLLPIIGSGNWGNDFPATSSIWDLPAGVTMTIDGHLVVSDSQNYLVRLINKDTKIVTSIAGTGEQGYDTSGPATSAKIGTPFAIMADPVGNIYFADQVNHVVSKLFPDGSGGYNISTFAGTGSAGTSGDGGPASSASLNTPSGLAYYVDGSGGKWIYIAQAHCIRVVNLSNGVISTVAGTTSRGFAGDGNLANDSSVRFSRPAGLAIYKNNSLLIADKSNMRIRQIDFNTGIINTVFGDGSDEVLSRPTGVVVADNDTLIVADNDWQLVRTFNMNTSIAGILAGQAGNAGFDGDGGLGTNALLYNPSAVLWTPDAVYITDQTNNRVRSVNLSNNIIQTYAGTGQQYSGPDGYLTLKTPISAPRGLYVDRVDGTMVWTEIDVAKVRRTIPGNNNTGIVNTLAGVGGQAFQGDGGPGTAAYLSGPRGITKAGNSLYWTEDYHVIRSFDLGSGNISTVVGIPSSSGSTGDGGPGTSAKLYSPTDVKASRSGSYLLIADTQNSAIRKYNFSNGVLTTVAGVLGSSGSTGNNGPATSAKLNYPQSVADDSAGNIYIADYANCAIRLVSPNGTISTFAGQIGDCGGVGDDAPATSVTLKQVTAVATNAIGDVYFYDGNAKIRKVAASTGQISTVAGNGTDGSAWAIGAASRPGLAANSTACLSRYVFGLNVDDYGNVYFVDWSQNVGMVVLGSDC